MVIVGFAVAVSIFVDAWTRKTDFESSRIRTPLHPLFPPLFAKLVTDRYTSSIRREIFTLRAEQRFSSSLHSGGPAWRKSSGVDHSTGPWNSVTRRWRAIERWCLVSFDFLGTNPNNEPTKRSQFVRFLTRWDPSLYAPLRRLTIPFGTCFRDE